VKKLALLALILALIVTVPLEAKRKDPEAEPVEEESLLSAGTFAGLALRGIGPALTSGRISDIAIHPEDKATWFVATASGGVWKTTNAGTTWTPLFDGEGSYSIGVVTIDPNYPCTIWVGTGENNSQRSVSYGDGVYKSIDCGASWTKVGLEHSEHIGKIIVDPRDSDTVFVAAQGPLWAPGGDRGLYKTVDGGETWELKLEISENTGVNDVVYDPRDPDVMYASSYQRRRHTWALVNGGPEGAIYKSVDGGETWNKLESGLPTVDMGRIGLAVSPADPDTVYAIIEAADDEGGFYRSTNAGASWEKRSDYVSGSAQYYNEIIPDPKNVDRVYAVDTWMQVTNDGGASFNGMGGYRKHVDDHALWIDPENTDHLINGNDGGVYESWDRGGNWRFMANLPVTQFYKATPDNDFPFYNVYGGTQDNATLGLPARNTSSNGITNADCYVTVFGDGFKTQVDPTNADIVYSQWQYGGLVRYDRKSGQLIDIQPQPAVDDDPLRWNWSSPLIISPHDHQRLYYAAQRVFRSDDMGDNWTPVSPDLSRQIDRNTLKIMGKVWSIDAVAKNDSTSNYGNIVSLAESPLTEDLLYAGTDEGRIQISENGGENWRAVDTFPGVPAMAYVTGITPSRHEADTVYATLDNHKQGDFNPYVIKSVDRGVTWTSVAGDLPERGQAHMLVEDHVRPELLFVGTEFGLWFTIDGGTKWIELSGGMPTIAVRDVEIQRRENDLVLGTFGRGFYILDDYSPLREVTEELLETDSHLFPVKKAWLFIEEARLGLRGKAFLGDDYFTAPNPPFGATFTFYIKEAPKTLKAQRQEAEKKVEEEGGDISYPDWEDLRAEDREEDPVVVVTITDVDRNTVRRFTAPAGSGIQRTTWDLRYPAFNPTSLEPQGSGSPWDNPPDGPLAPAGEYTVSMALRVNDQLTPLGEPQPFTVELLDMATMPAEDREAAKAFQLKTGRLQRAVLGANRALGEAGDRLAHLKKAVMDTPGADTALRDRARELEVRLEALRVKLSGDRTVASRNEPTPPSITNRLYNAMGGWSTTMAPTGTHQQSYRVAAELFQPVLADLRQLIEVDLAALEAELEAAGGPWTPGRVPAWSPE